MSTNVPAVQPTTSGIITQERFAAVMALDESIKRTRQEVATAEQSGNQMLVAITMATGMERLREQLTPLMPTLLKLRDTPMGFFTDGREYSTEQMRDVLIVGLLKGFRVLNKEIGVISANFYPGKEGMKRVVLSHPGLANLRIEFGVPSLVGEGALVPAIVSWTLNGRADKLVLQIVKDGDLQHDRRIPVRVNKGMLVDAVLGKAESKIYRRVYNLLTGVNLPIVEDLDDQAPQMTDPTSPAIVDAESFQASESPAEEAGDQSGQDEQQLQPLTEDSLLAEFLQGLQAAETPGDARKLYDAWFGPDSTREFEPHHNETAAKATAEREEQLRGSRGPRSNKSRAKQPELQGAS